MRIKRIVSLVLCIVITITASGCKAESNIEEEFYDCQKGFMGILGNRMCGLPDGYYFIMGYYLIFADKELKKTTFVCNKPECLHNQENMENKTNCDAFWSRACALSYYNGKLYVLADDWTDYTKVGRSIYEVSLDGSSRKVIYSGGEAVNAFCIHKGQGYVYEQKYKDKDGTPRKYPILTITKFQMDYPEKTEVLFETDDYTNVEINYLNFYQDYCYFIIFLPQDSNTTWIGKKVSLKTGEVTDSIETDNMYLLGKDRIFSHEIVEYNNDNHTWKDLYHQYSLDGKKQKQLTSENFPIIEKGAALQFVDDKYVYFCDITYGANEVPREKRKLYVYTYEGEFVCEIPNSMLHVPEFYPGNDRYLFVYDYWEDAENKKFLYYYIDKEKFGKDAQFECLYSGEFDEYYGEVVHMND